MLRRRLSQNSFIVCIGIAALALAMLACSDSGDETAATPTAPPGMFSTLPTDESPVSGDQPPTIEVPTSEFTPTPEPTQPDLHAGAVAYAVADADALPDGYATTDSVPRADGYACAHADSRPDGYALPDGHTVPDGDAVSDGHTVPDRDAAAYPRPHRDARARSRSDRDARANCY